MLILYLSLNHVLQHMKLSRLHIILVLLVVVLVNQPA